MTQSAYITDPIAAVLDWNDPLNWKKEMCFKHT